MTQIEISIYEEIQDLDKLITNLKHGYKCISETLGIQMMIKCYENRLKMLKNKIDQTMKDVDC